jgi:basic amino acid/polyamine antiporter, APA family
MSAPQRLKLFDLVMIVIGLVIGMGIFRTSKDAALAAYTPAIYFGAWVAGGVMALCGALTYAEIGARYPVTGAYYRIFSLAYHPSIAFALNIGILISNASSISAVALIGAGYIVPVFTNEPTQIVMQSVAITAILVFVLINLNGLRLSANTQNVLMVVKVLLLLLIISAIFGTADAGNEDPAGSSQPVLTWKQAIYSFGVALVAVSFSYGGYQQTINFGSEVNSAPRNVPRAIIAAIILVIALYLLTNVSYFLVVGFEEMKSSTEIAATVIERMFGSGSAIVFAIFLFLSVLAYVNVNLLSNPRVMYAMSMDGVLPSKFSSRKENSGVYPFSLVVYGGVSIVVVFFAETFERILSFSIFLDCLGYIASAATIFILRKKSSQPDKDVFTMRWYPFVPVFFILSYVFVAAVICLHTPYIALSAVAVVVASAILYFILKKRQPA